MSKLLLVFDDYILQGTFTYLKLLWDLLKLI